MLRPQVRTLSLRPSKGNEKDIAQETPDFIGGFAVSTVEIFTSDFVDVKKVFFPFCSEPNSRTTEYKPPSAWINQVHALFLFSHLTDDAETVREYVGLYESAPQMKPKDVQNYRKLSEYGDVVFAGMYSQKHGFMFCSWRQSDGGKYVAHGNYSPDYLVSKENFAVRAGLVDDDKLFTKEEAEELFKCAAFARDNCESLTYEQDRGLMELMEKLQTAYPHLKDNPPTFDDGENPILNM